MAITNHSRVMHRLHRVEYEWDESPSNLGIVLVATIAYQGKAMATDKEYQKAVADMLAKLRESNVYKIGDDPTPFPAVYGLDELVKDDRFPDMLAVAIANHFRRLAGEIQPAKARKTDPRGAVEEMAADGLDLIFESIKGDERKAKLVSDWMFNYLFALLAYRSKIISDALKTAAAARDPAK